jgi:hypothetical protein
MRRSSFILSRFAPRHQNAAFRTLSFGIDVDALVGLPNTGQSAQWPKVSQIVGRHIAGLGKDVCRNRQYGMNLAAPMIAVWMNR